MKITNFAVKNYQFTLIVFIMLVAIGINSLLTMPRGEDPDFSAPEFNIVVIYPGTSPKDMEQLVVDKIEKKINELDDIKTIKSKMDDGLAVLDVAFKYATDPDKKYQDVVREMDAIRPNLPADIQDIQIFKFSPSDVNIIQIALLSETAPYSELQRRSRQLKEDLEKIKSLKNVDNWAFPQQQVRIAVNLNKMMQNKLALNTVIRAIQSENVNIPGGSIDMGTKKYNIKTSGDYRTIDEIKNTVIASAGGKSVYVKDMAEVSFDYEEPNYIARLNGKRGVFVTASRKSGTNIFDVEKQTQPVLDHFKKTLPKSIGYNQSFNNAASVHKRLSGFSTDFAIAIGLVLLTLLPLGFRASVVVMISIPLSLAIGLFLLDMFGITINQLSIVGLVVALGLLVDDSIVVVENIERYLRMGYSKRNAAMAATKQIGLAVIGCTATLIFAFLPLLFLPEGAGDFIRSLPAAVVTTVLASLFVSLTIIPFLSSRILSSHTSAEGNIFLRGLKRLVSGSYKKLLHRSLTKPYLTLLVALVIFIGAIALVPVVGFSVFPASEKPMFLINIETPQGASLAYTDSVTRVVENGIKRIPDLKNYASNVGHDNPRIYYNIVPLGNSDNTAQIFVQLNGTSPVDKQKLIDRLRSKFKNFPNAKIEVKDFEQGPPVEAPIAIRLFSENLDTLRALSFQIENLLKKTPGTVYVNNDLTTLKTDIKVNVNKEKAAMLGVATSEIDKTIRMAVTGLHIGVFRREEDDEDDDINITLPRNGRQTFNVFNKINVASYNGTLVPLSQLADIGFQTSPTTIKHYDKDRYTVVTAFVQNGYNTAKLTSGILQQLNNMKFPEGAKYEAAGDVEASQQSFGGLGTIVLITVFGLLGVLILEFKTFRGTLIVLSVIPLGIIGAVAALLLSGNTFSFISVIGLIALIGIEVKNSILLVDYTDQLRREGKSVEEAIEEAGETRFIPIILTTLTAIGGLLPLALEHNPLYSPLALVIIGGLISSTLLTRVVTPVLYKLLAPKVLHEEEEKINPHENGQMLTEKKEMAINGVKR